MSVDPRTLGFFRIALASLLLFDLVRRVPGIETWYVDAGLIPGHTALWRPSRPWQFSLFFGVARPGEVAVAFGLCGLAYFALLLGYRTRLAHVASLVAILSLQGRVDVLSNGGDFVLCALMWWTLFLPLGRRFSVDAVRASLRERRETTPEGLAETAGIRDTRPVESIAVLGATLQLAVIYVFNALHKEGQTWMSGQAVHWVLQQERIITELGLLARAHVTPGISKIFTYGALGIEGSLPLLILSPFGRPWTRRLAIFFVASLHLGIAVVMNFGIFSPVMVVFSLLLLSAEDWEAVARRARDRKRRIVLHFDADCGICFAAMRLLARLDLFQRIEGVPTALRRDLPEGVDPAELDRTMLVVEPETGRWWVRSAAIGRIVRALPGGGFVAWVFQVPGLRSLLDRAYARLAENRTSVSVFFGWTACGTAGAGGTGTVVFEPPAARQTLREYAVVGRETLVALLLIGFGSQIFLENWAIPRPLRLQRPPAWLRTAVSYMRFQQGWSMFAPEAPVTEVSVVVDAWTTDGRRVDPYNEAASRVADPTLRRVPVRPDMDVYWVDYTMRIAHRAEYHGPLRDWIFRYHERTGSPEDRIVRFDAYLVEQDSPPPGEREPRNFRHRNFLSGRR
jgi:predicted DCC family thiol-disulfide oxidoreductase YuxK